jgi:hypothetical protein
LQVNRDKKNIQRINETKGQFFRKINKIDKPLANQTRRRGKNKINKMYITTSINEIQRILKAYFENLYSNKLENLEEMDKFIDVLDFQN